MDRVGFYLLGEKGLAVLQSFVEQFGPNVISFVRYGTDAAVIDDCSRSIVALCSQHGISSVHFRDERVDSMCELRFAIGWRWIINNPDNLVVIHDSLLPKYRGFAPLVNMLIAGESQIGASAIIASSKYDEGDILAQSSIDVKYPVKIQEAIEKIAQLYSGLCSEVYRNYKKRKQLIGTKQDHASATYSLWRDNDDYYIDWSEPADLIVRAVDALGFPYFGARIRTKEEVYILEQAQVERDVFVERRRQHVGKIIFIDRGCPVVVCGTGLVRMVRILDLDGQPITSFNFRTRFN